jgi:hypothetical protein
MVCKLSTLHHITFKYKEDNNEITCRMYTRRQRGVHKILADKTNEELHCAGTYVGSTTVKRVLILPYTIGQECKTADGQRVSTRPLSRNPNKQVLQGSTPFRFNDDELLVLFSSWKPRG